MQKTFRKTDDVTIAIAEPDSANDIELQALGAEVEIGYNISLAALQSATVEPSDLNLTTCTVVKDTNFEQPTGETFVLQVNAGGNISGFVTDGCWYDWRHDIAEYLSNLSPEQR